MVEYPYRVGVIRSLVSAALALALSGCYASHETHPPVAPDAGGDLPELDGGSAGAPPPCHRAAMAVFCNWKPAGHVVLDETITEFCAAEDERHGGAPCAVERNAWYECAGRINDPSGSYASGTICSGAHVDLVSAAPGPCPSQWAAMTDCISAHQRR